MSSRPPSRLLPAAAPTPTAPILAPEKARRGGSALTITPAALHPRRHIGDPSATPNPHISCPAKPRSFLPAVCLLYEAFGRRPLPSPSPRLAKGRRPKPFSIAAIPDQTEDRGSRKLPLTPTPSPPRPRRSGARSRRRGSRRGGGSRSLFGGSGHVKALEKALKLG